MIMRIASLAARFHDPSDACNPDNYANSELDDPNRVTVGVIPGHAADMPVLLRGRGRSDRLRCDRAMGRGLAGIPST